MSLWFRNEQFLVFLLNCPRVGQLSEGPWLLIKCLCLNGLRAGKEKREWREDFFNYFTYLTHPQHTQRHYEWSGAHCVNICLNDIIDKQVWNGETTGPLPRWYMCLGAGGRVEGREKIRPLPLSFSFSLFPSTNFPSALPIYTGLPTLTHWAWDSLISPFLKHLTRVSRISPILRKNVFFCYILPKNSWFFAPN